MANTNTETATWFQTANAQRTERRLRELASDNADAVERGDMTVADANALYERTATRLMYDL